MAQGLAVKTFKKLPTTETEIPWQSRDVTDPYCDMIFTLDPTVAELKKVIHRLGFGIRGDINTKGMLVWWLARAANHPNLLNADKSGLDVAKTGGTIEQIFEEVRAELKNEREIKKAKLETENNEPKLLLHERVALMISRFPMTFECDSRDMAVNKVRAWVKKMNCTQLRAQLALEDCSTVGKRTVIQERLLEKIWIPSPSTRDEILEKYPNF